MQFQLMKLEFGITLQMHVEQKISCETPATIFITLHDSVTMPPGKHNYATEHVESPLNQVPQWARETENSSGSETEPDHESEHVSATPSPVNAITVPYQRLMPTNLFGEVLLQHALWDDSWL